MIAVPLAPSATTTQGSSTAGTMMNHNSTDEWPSLGGSPAAENTSSGADNDWEMLSPGSGAGAAEEQGDHHTIATVVVVNKPHPPCLLRKNSQSAPDLRELEDGGAEEESEAASNEDEDDFSSSLVMVSTPPSVADDTTAGGSAVMVSNNNNNNPWANKNKVSFKDAILSPSKHAQALDVSAGVVSQTHKSSRAKTKKIKSRYVVVKPIKRCAKSTGDLLSLAEQEEEELHGGGGGGGAPMGETDAMDYYHRKSHGAKGRENGLKLRPDEAKRKEMIVNKKNAQRQQQGK